uniref:Uncharacterized protein n=1 Tax=Arundo donax TaxID=35708 RepID=A0A0A8Y6U4_ARUDO
MSGYWLFCTIGVVACDIVVTLWLRECISVQTRVHCHAYGQKMKKKMPLPIVAKPLVSTTLRGSR